MDTNVTIEAEVSMVEVSVDAQVYVVVDTEVSVEAKVFMVMIGAGVLEESNVSVDAVEDVVVWRSSHNFLSF